MSSTDLVPDRRPTYLRGGDETLIDFRRRRELVAEERVERRRLNFAEQTAEMSAPGVRISAWETAHGLRMPSSPEHPILEVIAITTRLSLAEVREEQSARLRLAVPRQ